MLTSMYSAISGMESSQTDMDVIGNNIANVNTTGFKAGRATFEDAMSQVLQGASMPTATTGGTDPVEVGLGVFDRRRAGAGQSGQHGQHGADHRPRHQWRRLLRLLEWVAAVLQPRRRDAGRC